MTVLKSLYESYLEPLYLDAWQFSDRIQADKLQTLIKAANIEDVEPIWTTLFAKVRGHNQYDVGTRGMGADLWVYRLSRERMLRIFC
jgi:hypothetical protein